MTTTKEAPLGAQTADPAPDAPEAVEAPQAAQDKPQATASTDMVRAANTGIGFRARQMYDPGQIALIKATVGKELNDGELGMFLEVCARYELDPFTKQIWPLKIQGQVHIVASRDGLLSLANRHTPDGDYHSSGAGMFLGCSSDVVREHDYFDKGVDGQGHVSIDHRYRNAAGEPTHGGKDGGLRGPIIGAWAYVRREGHADTYFFAYAKEYDQGKNVWKSHPTAMMQKCPETMALRKAFSITGVIGESEVHSIEGADRAAGASPALTSAPVQADYGPDPAVAEKLAELFDLLGYSQRKRLIKTLGPVGNGLDHAGRLHLIAELVAEGRSRGLIEEEIADAEVVVDAPAATEVLDDETAALVADMEAARDAAESPEAAAAIQQQIDAIVG